MNITFRQVDAFRTVVSTGSVTEAASVLGISQPAVSRLLTDLEKEVGFKLFSRVGRNLVPTAESRLLGEEVKRALSGLERIKDAARSIRSFKNAQLRVVTTPTFASLLSTDLMQQYARRRPEVKISLEIQSTDDTVEWMLSEHFDFGIMSPVTRNPAFENLPLLQENAVCIVPANHALASKKSVTAIDLSGKNFISYMPDSMFRFEIDRLFESVAEKRILRYEARTSEAILDMVAHGLGLSIVGAVNLERLRERSLCAVPFKPSLPFCASLVWPSNRVMTAVAKDFLAMLATDGKAEAVRA